MSNPAPPVRRLVTTGTLAAERPRGVPGDTTWVTTMKFMFMVKAKETNEPPPPAMMTAIEALGVEARAAGALLMTGGLGPSALGTRVRVQGGNLSVTDGPFAEAKEVVGGFAIYELPSKEEALAWTRRFMDLHSKHWPGWNGEVEIRPLFGSEDDFGC